MNGLNNIVESFLTHPLFKLDQMIFTFGSFINLIFVLLVVWLIAKLIHLIFKHWILIKFDRGNREAIATLMAYICGTVSIIVFLQASGFDFSSLVVVAAGLGIGIGFGLQNMARDFISGLIILLRRSIKVDDFLEFGGRQDFNNLQGTVKNISLLSTIIQTRDGASLIIPNSNLVTQPILNWSYGSSKNRLKIPIYVRQDSDMVLFTETVLNTADREAFVLSEPPPELIFKKLGDTYLEFELQVWVDNIKEEERIKSVLNYALEYHLRQQDIRVSFPNHEIFLRDSNSPTISRLLGRNPADIDINLRLITRKPLSIRDSLQKVTYFENFTELELRYLIENGYQKSLETKQILFNEGDPGDAFYIILSGSVEVFSFQTHKHLATLKEGAFFGELSLILGIPRTASVRTLEPTILFAINHEGFKKILHEQKELTEVIIQKLAQHQEELIQRKQHLQKLGLIAFDEDDNNLVIWLRNRLKTIFF